jgi:hypothetical protein
VEIEGAEGLIGVTGREWDVYQVNTRFVSEFPSLRDGSRGKERWTYSYVRISRGRRMRLRQRSRAR